MRLRMKILIGILIPLILSVVSIGSLSIYVYRDILYQQLEKNSIQLNRSYAREMDNSLKFFLSMVEKIAYSVSLSENVEDVFRQDKKINPFFKSYYYTNRNGDILAHYPRHPNLKKNNFPTVKFWNEIVATNQPVISAPDSSLGYNAIFIGAPVTAAYGLQKTSKDKRLIYVSISLDELFKTIADTRISEKRDIFVVGQSGQFLTSGKAEWVMPRKFSQIGNDKTFEDIEAHMVSLISGSGYYTVNHQRYFISFMPVASARWSLAVNILESEFINDISRLTQIVSLSLVGIIVILILLTYMTINSITSPVLHLTESMKKVEKGNLNIISTIESNDEIGMLASVFNRMINHIKVVVENLTKEIKEIKYSEEKYRNIFNNTTEGIFQSTPSGRFVTVNPAFAAIFGYDSPEEMICYITDISKQLYVNPNDREAFEKLIGKDNRVVNFKGRAYKKNGDIIQLAANAHVVQNDKGEIMRYEGVIKDITKKMQAEKLKVEKETATASTQAKSEFLAAMSYEIKTPLNAITGMTELTLDTELSAKQRKRLEIIRSAAFSLSELVNDILDFSRIESG
ncbi:cache domain-containing protein, partial [Desulfobacterales bacterium HSG16]|nr:cache domain-containing protein [Desulfobacterales bacterium HSG16]